MFSDILSTLIKGEHYLLLRLRDSPIKRVPIPRLNSSLLPKLYPSGKGLKREKSRRELTDNLLSVSDTLLLLCVGFIVVSCGDFEVLTVFRTDCW